LPYDVKSTTNPTADKGSLGVCRPYYVHRDIGPGEDTYLCAAKTLGKPCPICEHRAKLAREGADDDVIKALKPKERTLYNIIDTANREDGVQLLDYSDWLLGKYLRGKIEGADPKERDAFELYADLSEGMTVKIVTTEEKGAGGSWMVCNNIEFKPRDKQYEDEMLSKTFDLDAIISETPYEKLRAIFLQEPAATKDEPEDKPEDMEQAQKWLDKFLESNNWTSAVVPTMPAAKDNEPEPEDDDEPEFKVGSWVEFEYKDKTRVGEIVKITDDLFQVKCDDREKPYNMERDDLALTEKPAPPKGKGKEPTAEKNGEIGIGSMVMHKTHKLCEVVKLKDGKLTLEDDDGELHPGIKLADVKLQGK
jgi:hypothetical protein